MSLLDVPVPPGQPPASTAGLRAVVAIRDGHAHAVIPAFSDRHDAGRLRGHTEGLASGDEVLVLLDEAGDPWVAARPREPEQVIPAGTIAPFAGVAAPEFWLLADGAARSRTTYARLFAVVGTAFGSGDGSTTFNVPDLRGRVPVGLDNLGGSDAGRLGVANSLGGTGGAETHTLTEAQMPSHTHPPASGYEGFWQADTAAGNVIQGGPTYQANNGVGATGATGGGGAHNNMQPYLLIGWIIKT